jgi:replication factor A1
VAPVPTEDLKIHAKEVMSLLGDHADSVTADDVEAELYRFLEYGVPLAQAKQTVIKKYGGSFFSNGSAAMAKRTIIQDLQPNQRSVKLLAKIISINPKDITVKGEKRQIFYGLLRDESGTVSFTAWNELESKKGDIVEITNAYTREWQGTIDVNIGDRTYIETKDDTALPKEAFEPKKCTIKELHTSMGTVDITAVVLEVEHKDVEVEGQQKKMFSGVLGDETGKTPFSAWNDFKLKKGDTIHIVGASVRGWKGIAQISFDENATVGKAQKKINPKDVPLRTLMMYETVEQQGAFDVEVKGVVTEIQPGSGFIFRCPQCNRALFNNECRTHGAVEGQPDIRLKCAVDDGTGVVSAIFDRSMSEQLLEKTLDECKAMNPDDLIHTISKKVYAQHLRLRGNSLRDQFGTTFLVKSLEKDEIDIKEEALSMQHDLEAIP